MIEDLQIAHQTLETSHVKQGLQEKKKTPGIHSALDKQFAFGGKWQYIKNTFIRPSVNIKRKALQLCCHLVIFRIADRKPMEEVSSFMNLFIPLTEQLHFRYKNVETCTLFSNT